MSVQEANKLFLDTLKREKRVYETIDLASYQGSVKTKSDLIRALHRDGYSIGNIASSLNIRYQHARNVILYVPKK
jgi:hypothetical protein